MSDSIPLLSQLEARVLGTLVEKQRTVPDTYPLSLNALAAGCNQKTSRFPVMEASDSFIRNALESLKAQALVAEMPGSRVVRYEHRLEKVLGIPKQSSALLTVLLLRGPQTVGELRLNADRLHSFADTSSVEVFLEEMASREAGALVVELPRAPGARENRWMHLLSGMPDVELVANSRALGSGAAAQNTEDLRNRISALEAEVVDLRAMLVRLSAELGVQ
ncbi:MAG: YceH family protein [Azonexus sp.]